MAEHPVSIVVATYGDDPRYPELAKQRAIPSARRQGCEVIWQHGTTLAEARNHGALRATNDWLVFLDADDELGDGYIREITRVTRGPIDLVTPSVQYVHPRRTENPRLLTPRNLRGSSYLIIGTMVNRQLFFDVGGFQEWRAYEDWAMFLRCWQLGARVQQAPRAIYRAHMHPQGRNRVRNPRQLCSDILRAHDEWEASR